MGQNLTHGIYLPDEGERNCYNGLAANWSILDGAVGTIAEHTTQIAGKAPLVHTHVTADITDFPAYGTTAGTICEGNDSRLSDARTPVAHTHTKSDVTDLFNSANTWTGGNTFTSKALFHVTEDPTYVLKSSTMQEGVVPSENRTAYTGSWQDKNSSVLGYDRFSFYSTVNVQAYEVNLRNKATNGSFDPNGSQIQSGYQLVLSPSGNSELKIYAHTLPNGNGVWNLGDSTHKWKSLNGINPGALSLPDYSKAGGLDVSAQGLNWDLTGATSNSYTPTFDGYLILRCKDTNGDFLFAAYGGSNAIIRNCAAGTGVLPGNAGLCLLIPMQANTSISIQVKATANFRAYIIPCFGNV